MKKDDTDTVFAAKEAMRRGFDEFLLVGVSGGRLDHTLVNVYLLVMLREQGKRALLVDDYSEMELVGAEKVEIPERFPFYSLVNITGTAGASRRPAASSRWTTGKFIAATSTAPATRCCRDRPLWSP